MRQIKLGAEKMFFGEGAVAALADLPAQRKRAYIVMSGTIQKDLGQLDAVTGALESAGFAWKANTDVEPEPCWESVSKGVDEMRAFEPDWVIGFGGGSAMDAAKAMWVFYENPQYSSLEEVMPPAVIGSLRVKARICCIPTSAGTGSECTRAALIKDPVKKRKYSIRDYNGRLVPDVAIIDPSFSTTMPRAGTVACGMDALTHAIESYVTPLANPFSDALAIGGWIYGYRNLPICANDPDNLTARGEMLAASCLAGIAFSNCALGICHGIAHTFGATYGIGHGLANAIVLPYSIAFNAENDARAAERYEELAGFVGRSDMRHVIVDLRKELGIPQAMQQLMPDAAEFEAALDELVEKVLTDVATPANPVKVTDEQARDLLHRVYYGP